MIDLQKLIADCDFHIKRGDNMVMTPKLLKELAERLLDDDEEFETVQTVRDFEAEQVEAAKALQPAHNQTPFCYMSDKYEIGLFTKQPDNPAYFDFFPVYKEPQPAPDVQELVDALKRFVVEGAELEPQKRYLWQEGRAALAKHEGPNPPDRGGK